MTHVTLVIYNSGRTEVISHLSKDDMERTRAMLSIMPTVAEFKTPSKEELRNASKKQAY